MIICYESSGREITNYEVLDHLLAKHFFAFIFFIQIGVFDGSVFLDPIPKTILT